MTTLNPSVSFFVVTHIPVRPGDERIVPQKFRSRKDADDWIAAQKARDPNFQYHMDELRIDVSFVPPD